MENKIKCIIGVLVCLCGFGIFINAVYNQAVFEKEIRVQNTSEITTDSTNTTETTKVSKKVVKTTKKTTKKITTKKKTVKKVKTASYSEYQQYAKSYGNYNDDQMSCLINLWNRESGWNPNSYNKKTSACGIPQAVPCSKIQKSEGSNDWKAQIRWGVKYITYRYKTPCGAWKHFQNKHWY